MYKYYIPDHGETPESARNIPDSDTYYNDEGADIAGLAAEYEHNSCDGWEAEWPLEFVILDKEDNEIGRYTVEREYSPEFSVFRKDK